jgi:PKD repeat protein/Zn-dependent protease
MNHFLEVLMSSHTISPKIYAMSGARADSRIFLSGHNRERLARSILLVFFLFCCCIPVIGSAAPVNTVTGGFIQVIDPPVADFFTDSRYGTSPFMVSFSDLSKGDPTAWSWDFGDGSTSHDQNPAHLYRANGIYTVSLTITNRYGQDTRTVPAQITVGDSPVPDFSASPSEGEPPLSVHFTGTAGSNVTSWRWDFGDSVTSSVQDPWHTYLRPGVYSVTLEVSNAFGTQTITKHGLIKTGIAPGAEFVAETREGNPPLTVQFRDFSSGSPTVWSWDFGDGTVSSDKNPVHTFAAPESYNIRLTVSNAIGTGTQVKPSYVVVGHEQVSSVPTPQVTVTPASQPAGEEQDGGVIGLIREAKGTTEKNLPTSGIIPPQYMAVAAVLTSLGIVFINILMSSVGALSQFSSHIAKFFADLAGGHAVEKMSAKEIEKRGIAATKRERHFFGLSAIELLIVEVAIFIVACAFIVADRAELTLLVVFIYILVGAISVVLHDFAHRYMMTRYGHEADIQFWGLGTVVMFATAWLYGNAFAQPYRNLADEEAGPEPGSREAGLEMVAGPCVSIILMLFFLALMQLGGIWATAGGIGFIINLITAVYSMMPIATMDGLAIWKWNRAIYLVLFIPLIAFYFITYVLV